MARPVDRARGRIVDYDGSAVTIRVPYSDVAAYIRRGYKDVEVTFIDSRRLSDKQRRSSYAMIREIADYCGTSPDEAKDMMKLSFTSSILEDTADNLLSLSNASMSVVAAFQSFLARFIVSHDIPTRFPMLDMVDDVEDYVYSCLVNKKCCICGRPADLHHVDAVGMGRDRTEIIHEGMRVLPLCRVHHTEAHTKGNKEFIDLYHLGGGIEADKTICRIYGLKKRKEKRA